MINCLLQQLSCLKDNFIPAALRRAHTVLSSVHTQQAQKKWPGSHGASIFQSSSLPYCQIILIGALKILLFLQILHGIYS